MTIKRSDSLCVTPRSRSTKGPAACFSLNISIAYNIINSRVYFRISLGGGGGGGANAKYQN